MTGKDMEKMKDKLEQEGKRIEGVIKTMKENRTADQEQDYPTEISNYDNHPADLGTEVYMVGMNNALMVHQEWLLKEIQDALERIKKGTYGTCEICGNDILYERLEAIPYARLCMKCEEEKGYKPEIARNMRPNGDTGDTGTGVMSLSLNRLEDNEYEGMDILNDVLKYGSSDTPQDMGGYHDYKDFYTNKVDMQGVVDKMDNISDRKYRKQAED